MRVLGAGVLEAAQDAVQKRICVFVDNLVITNSNRRTGAAMGSRDPRFQSGRRALDQPAR